MAIVVVLVSLAMACSGDEDDDGNEDEDQPAVTATEQAEPTRGVTTSPTATATGTATPAAIDEPGERGPYEVGVTTFTYTRTSTSRGQPREIETVVWYPSEQATPVDDSLKGVKDAPILGDTPLPLIVFSHGSGGNTLQSTFLTTHLASHGFVVASVSHAGNTTADCFPCSDRAGLEDSYRNRPDDVAFIRDQLLGRGEQTAGIFAGRLDMERVGITGHSFGGYTTVAALALGGWDAGAALAPVDIALPGAMLSDIEVPLLVYGARLDDTTPFFMQENIFAQATNASARLLVELPHGGHLSFSNFCLAFAAGCGEDDIDPQLAQELINAYLTAFFRNFLNGEEAYAAYLLPGSEPDDEVIVVEAIGLE